MESMAKVTPATGKPQSPCCPAAVSLKRLRWDPGEVTGLPGHLRPGPGVQDAPASSKAGIPPGKDSFHQPRGVVLLNTLLQLLILIS